MRRPAGRLGIALVTLLMLVRSLVPPGFMLVDDRVASAWPDIVICRVTDDGAIPPSDRGSGDADKRCMFGLVNGIALSLPAPAWLQQLPKIAYEVTFFPATIAFANKLEEHRKRARAPPPGRNETPTTNV
jgi:hypothetical protein